MKFRNYCVLGLAVLLTGTGWYVIRNRALFKKRMTSARPPQSQNVTSQYDKLGDT